MANSDGSVTWGVYLGAETVPIVEELVEKTGWSKSKTLGTLVRWMLHGTEEVEGLLPSLRAALDAMDINPVVNVARHVLEQLDEVRSEVLSMDTALYDAKHKQAKLQEERDRLAEEHEKAEDDLELVRVQQSLLNNQLEHEQANVTRLENEVWRLNKMLTSAQSQSTESLSPDFLARTLLLMTRGLDGDEQDNVALITGLLAHTREMNVLTERVAAMEKELEDLRDD